MTPEQLHKAIYIRAIARLAARDYSKLGLETKLIELKKKYPKNKLYPLFTTHRVRPIIQELEDQGLIHEERAIRNTIESSLRGKYGLRRVILKLKTKKYPANLVEEIAKEFEHEPRDLEMITKSAQRKYDQWKKKAANDKNKLFQIRHKLNAFLASKGFSFEEIERISREIKK